MGLYRIIWDYPELSRTIWELGLSEYLGLSGTIWDYLGLYCSIWDCLGLSGTNSEYLGLSGSMDYIGLSVTIWDYLGISGTICTIWEYLGLGCKYKQERASYCYSETKNIFSKS